MSTKPKNKQYNTGEMEKLYAETSSRWTVKFVPDITRWMERKFDEVNCYLTQLLSKHGYFCMYTYIFGHYNPSDRIFDPASHTTYVVRANITHK